MLGLRGEFKELKIEFGSSFSQQILEKNKLHINDFR